MYVIPVLRVFTGIAIFPAMVTVMPMIKMRFGRINGNGSGLEICFSNLFQDLVLYRCPNTRILLLPSLESRLAPHLLRLPLTQTHTPDAVIEPSDQEPFGKNPFHNLAPHSHSRITEAALITLNRILKKRSLPIHTHGLGDQVEAFIVQEVEHCSRFRSYTLEYLHRKNGGAVSQKKRKI